MKKKIKSFKEVCKVCKGLQKEGKTIVFVHGFFDILHKGHVELLEEAKKLGDVLVVGVGHDYNASFLKGPGRPINDHDSRMHMLSKLTDTDLIFLIDSIEHVGDLEKFYTSMYMDLKPNIVATSLKAGKHGVLKKRQAEKAGVKFVDIKHSLYRVRTSKIIDKLRSNLK